MPFKSEKQRRYLWLKHPDIAKRWAKEYPAQKDLPMYADKKDTAEKQAMIQFLNGVLQNYLENYKTPNFALKSAENTKASDSKQEYIKLPTTHGPTFAGESEAQATPKPVEDGLNDGNNVNTAKKDELSAQSLFKKLAVVLSPKLMQEIENEQAQQQAREAQRMPQNVGVKRLPPAVNSIMPPMGMAQPAPNPGQTQPTQPPQSPTGQLASVGGGASPNANPINAFGGLSSTGDINGNAALGTQNSVGGEKLAGKSDALAWLMSIDNCNIPDPEELDYDERMKSATEKFSAVGLWDRIRAKRARGGKPAKPGDKDYPDAKSWKKVTAISEKQSEKKCSCGCGDTVTTCKCSASCSCRQKGGSCYKPEKTAASTPAWQRSAGKNEEGGLNAKGRASYNRATGGNLKAPVTESNPKGKRAKRQNSFCSRMCGMKRVNTGSKTKKDPESRINKALRKWNCKCSSEKQAGWPNTAYSLTTGAPSLAMETTPLQAALGAAAGAGYGGLTGKGVVRNALRGGLIGTGAGIGNAFGSQGVAGLNADINGPHDSVLNNNSFMLGSTAGTIGGALGGNQLYNVLERMYDKRRAKTKSEKKAQAFDPNLSPEAHTAIMHGTGLVGSGALGTVAGMVPSAGIEHLLRSNNWMPNQDKSPVRHLLAQSLIRAPMIAGGMLGMRLYDNYIMGPQMKREEARKKQEMEMLAALNKGIAKQGSTKVATNLDRVLATALVSAGGGLALGAYPGMQLQRASEAAGNPELVNFVAGKAPIAVGSAVSAGLYNYLRDRAEAKQQPKKKAPAKPTGAGNYLQYLVH